MKILQTSDWHLGEYPGPTKDNRNLRYENIVKCLDFMVEVATQEKPDITLIPGDITNKSKLWGDQTLTEMREVASKIIRLSHISPVVVMFGTANHDSIEMFHTFEKWFAEDPMIKIVCNPELFEMHTNAGPIQIGVVPGFDKGHFLANNVGLDPGEANLMASEGLGAIIRGFGAQLDRSKPSVLMSHYTVAGSSYDNGNTTIFLESEVILTPETIDSSGFDMVCLGHIHKPQQVTTCCTPTFYSGAIENLNFNDEGSDKGFWIHEMDWKPGDMKLNSKYHLTPALQYLTIKPKAADIQEYMDAGCTVHNWLPPVQSYNGKIVRVRYTAEAEHHKRLDRAQIEREIMAAGAFWVAEVMPEKIVEELTRIGMNESMEPEQTLEHWLESKGFTPETNEEMVKMAEPIIQEVIASKSAGRHVGIFEPLHIEVRNYRSYLEESFDFTQVRFATVNGPNGIGKSSLFMDSIYDCLYEDPREGDLTGWINDSEAIRSGMISFTFKMGDAKFRVTRSRTKGGKVTLNLAEEINGEWQDRSADKTTETQEKIEQLIGMDKTTFKSCAMIMQDDYAVFLKADKSARMAVLGNTIGLGIYEDLHEKTKSKGTEINRQITQLKDRRSLLLERTDKELELNQEFMDITSEIAALSQQILTADTELTTLNTTMKYYTDKKQQIEELEKQVAALLEKYNTKNAQKSTILQQVDEDTKLAHREQEIIAAAEEVERLNHEITRLKAILPQHAEAIKQSDNAYTEYMQTEREAADLETKITNMKVPADKEAEIKSKAAEYESLKAKLDDMETRYTGSLTLDQKIAAAQKEYDRIKSAHELDIQTLQNTIDTLRHKTTMLTSANCIDIDKAQCLFLKDALEARSKIAGYEAKMEQLKSQEPWEEQDIILEGLRAERTTNGFDHAVYSKLKQDAAERYPFYQNAQTLDANKEAVISLEAMRKSLADKAHKAMEQRQEWKNKATALAEELQPLSTHQARVVELKPTAELKENLQAANERLKNNYGRLTEMTFELEEVKNEGVAARGKLDGLRGEIEGSDDLQLKITEKTRQIENMKAEEGGLKTRLGGVSHQLDEIRKIRKEINDLDDAIAKKAKESVNIGKLTEAFSQDGIPFMITKAIVPELEANANAILGQMTGGKMTIEMKTEKQLKSKKEVNTLEVWIKEQGKSARPFLSFSGGQRVKVALAVAFALAQLKAKRAGVQLGMLFIDEPPYLDGPGTEAYADSLEGMALLFPTMRILAISHDNTMKARFMQNIQVVSTEQGSKVIM